MLSRSVIGLLFAEVVRRRAVAGGVARDAAVAERVDRAAAGCLQPRAVVRDGGLRHAHDGRAALVARADKFSAKRNLFICDAPSFNHRVEAEIGSAPAFSVRPQSTAGELPTGFVSFRPLPRAGTVWSDSRNFVRKRRRRDVT